MLEGLCLSHMDITGMQIVENLLGLSIAKYLLEKWAASDKTFNFYLLLLISQVTRPSYAYIYFQVGRNSDILLWTMHYTFLKQLFFNDV